MKFAIILLAFTNVALGQVKDPDCLDMPGTFALFIPQVKNSTKAKPITDVSNYLHDSLYLRVNFAAAANYDPTIKGIVLELINTTKEEFPIYKSIHDLFCQIKYKGSWLTIERSVTCSLCDDVPLGLVIPSNGYIRIIMPCYQGTEQVTMRYRFAIGNRALYTEEFQGMINPGLLK